VVITTNSLRFSPDIGLIMGKVKFVRASLPLMLAISLALHVGLAAGLLVSHLHALRIAVATSSAAPAPSLIVLRSVENPDSSPLALAKSVPTHLVPDSASNPLPSMAQPVVATKNPAVALAPASLALEANPNAHIRALPPEMILSPAHAPHLDGANGVVFILDISGSMYEPFSGSTRLAIARQLLSDRILALKDGTPFAITLYAQSAYTSGPLVAASDETRHAAVRFILHDVDCGGGTNLPAGLESAAQLQAGHLVVVSDGDLNISDLDLLAKAHKILGPTDKTPALTVIGVCPRPQTDATHLMEDLAKEQGGTYQTAQFEDPNLLTASRGQVEAETP